MMMRWIGLLALSTMTVLLWAGCGRGVTLAHVPEHGDGGAHVPEHGDGGLGAACKSDADCVAWASCMGGECVALSCTTNDDCGSGTICNQCIGSCTTPQCTTDADCAVFGGEFCNAGICVECTSDADCNGMGGCDCCECS